MTATTAQPAAYTDGYAYGLQHGWARGRTDFAAGYTGAEIRGAGEVTDKAAAYSLYCDGYAAGVRANLAAAKTC